MSKIQLGMVAKDTISGFTGVVYGETKWLNGCVRFALRPRELSNDGKPIEDQWFDESDLEIISDSFRKPKIPSGGPMKDPSF